MFPIPEVALRWTELKAICRRAGGDREWKARLASVAGIYLITDEDSGALYVGSAYGTKTDGGIWGRWCTYAETGGHGGNDGLLELLREPHRVHRLRWTILQTMSRSTPSKDVVRAESAWKDRLGSRATRLGYNLN